MFTLPPLNQNNNPNKNSESHSVEKFFEKNEFDQFTQINKRLTGRHDKFSEQITQLELQCRRENQPDMVTRGAHLRKIPEFWTKTLLKHKDCRPYLEDEDVISLLRNHLVDIEIVYAFDPRFGEKNMQRFGEEGSVIKMEFTENQAFNNRFLTKAFGKSLNEEKYEVSFCEGTVIDWKSKKMMRKYTGKEDAETCSDSEDEDEDYLSFFGWVGLSTNSLSEDHVLDDEGMDKLAKAIAEEIWASPMEYYEIETEDEDSDDDLDVNASDDDDGDSSDETTDDEDMA